MSGVEVEGMDFFIPSMDGDDRDDDSDSFNFCWTSFWCHFFLGLELVFFLFGTHILNASPKVFAVFFWTRSLL